MPYQNNRGYSGRSKLMSVTNRQQANITLKVEYFDLYELENAVRNLALQMQRTNPSITLKELVVSTEWRSHV